MRDALVLLGEMTLGWVLGAFVIWLVRRWLKMSEVKQGHSEMSKVIQVLEREIEHLSSLNKDLLDRLFQSRAMPPSGVDLTEVYEERKKNEREHKERTKGNALPPGPLERLEARWKEKDLKAAESGIDLTKPNDRAN